MALRFRGALHIQTVNSRHGQLKAFLHRYRGIATKYLDSYLRWFHLIGLSRPALPKSLSLSRHEQLMHSIH